MKEAERPTFHDIRAIGIFRYEKQGVAPTGVISLSGHASEVMRLHYEEGHELPPAKLISADRFSQTFQAIAGKLYIMVGMAGFEPTTLTPPV
jgi:hypothetical protein